MVPKSVDGRAGLWLQTEDPKLVRMSISEKQDQEPRAFASWEGILNKANINWLDVGSSRMTRVDRNYYSYKSYR